MKTLTIELDDEAYDMLRASAAEAGKTMEYLAALPVDSMARQDGHVVWDVEFTPGQFHRRDLRRGDVTQCLETEATGMVVDATGSRVRIAVTRHVRDAYSAGHRIIGPDQDVTVTIAAPVDGLKVGDWSIFNDPSHGCFTPSHAPSGPSHPFGLSFYSKFVE